MLVFCDAYESKKFEFVFLENGERSGPLKKTLGRMADCIITATRKRAPLLIYVTRGLQGCIVLLVKI